MNQPKQIIMPWAENGLKNDIPNIRGLSTPQEGATYQDGFPSITMTPISVGGKPPSGRDMNGILYEITANLAFLGRGKHYKFNQDYCSAINGYPKGAILVNNAETALYISRVDQNQIDFNSQPNNGNWIMLADTALKSELLAEINKKATTADFNNLKNLLVGIPFPYPLAAVPSGCLAFNGQTFNKITYPILAQKYPSGVLPDLRGEFIRGWDNGRRVDAGRGLLSAQGDIFKSHYHSLMTTAGASSSDSIIQFGLFKDVSTDPYSSISVDSRNSNDAIRDGFPLQTYNTGENETRPRNIAFQYICLVA